MIILREDLPREGLRVLEENVEIQAALRSCGDLEDRRIKWFYQEDSENDASFLAPSSIVI